MSLSVTFTSRLGETLGPILLWLRDINFFEWYVYMPLMTIASVGLFWKLSMVLRSNGRFDEVRTRRRPLWLTAYFGLCFLLTNSLAVAFKTLIVEELDYPTRVWFEAYISPVHFYIVAVVVVYLVLLVRNKRETWDWVLGFFVQVGLVAGYGVGIFRVFNEPISMGDPTSGMSGFILCTYFGFYNYDLYWHLVGDAP